MIRRQISKLLLVALASLTLPMQFPYVATAANLDVNVSHFAGTGGTGQVDGSAEIAQFNNPIDVASTQSGEVFIIDQFNAVRKLNTDLSVSTIYQFPLGTYLCSLDIDSREVLWIVACSTKTIYRFSKTGNLLSTFQISENREYPFGWTGSAFLPNGRLLVPITAMNKLIEISESGMVTDYYKGEITGNCEAYPKPNGIFCPVSVAASNTGEILIVNEGNQNELYRLSSSKDLSRVNNSLMGPKNVQFLNGSFYLQVSEWTGVVCFSSRKYYKLSENLPPELIHTGEGNPWGGPGFTLVGSNRFIFAGGTTNRITVLDRASNSVRFVGNAGLGCKSGPKKESNFFQPHSLIEGPDKSIYVKDDGTIRRISSSGLITTSYSPAGWIPLSQMYLEGNSILFLNTDGYLLSLELASGLTFPRYPISITGDTIQYSARSTAFDSKGNLYIILNRGGDQSNKFLRKVDRQGNFKDFTGLNIGNLEVALDFDDKDNFYMAINGQIRKYTNIDASQDFSVAGSYFGSSPVLEVAKDGSIFVASRNHITVVINRIRNGVTDNLVQGSYPGSTNAGRNSSFNDISDILALSSGELLISERMNHVIRSIEIGRPSSEVNPTPTASPSPTSSPTLAPTPKTPEVQKPTSPILKGVNFVGNTLNISVNIGSGERKPDNVFIVAPLLGLSSGSASRATILGDQASWTIPLSAELSGKKIPIRIISSKSGIDSDALETELQIPGNFASRQINSSAPIAPKNARYNIKGLAITIRADAVVKKSANPTGGFLASPALGLVSDNAIRGVYRDKVLTIVLPVTTALAGKSTKVLLYLDNEVGASKPTSLTIRVPAASAASSLKPSQGSIATVVCKKGAMTRTFAAKSCPPGWKKP